MDWTGWAGLRRSARAGRGPVALGGLVYSDRSAIHFQSDGWQELETEARLPPSPAGAGNQDSVALPLSSSARGICARRSDRTSNAPPVLHPPPNITYCVKCLNQHKSGTINIGPRLTFRHILAGGWTVQHVRVRGLTPGILKWIFCFACTLLILCGLALIFLVVIFEVSSFPQAYVTYKPIDLCTFPYKTKLALMGVYLWKLGQAE
jgi:hypothetical protein